MNLGDAKIFIDVLLGGATVALGIYVWLTKKSQVNARRIAKLEEDIDGQLKDQVERLVRIEEGAIVRADIDRLQDQIKNQADRLATSESAHAHAIRREDLDELHSRVTRQSEALARLEGQFGQANKTLALIHNFLIEKR